MNETNIAVGVVFGAEMNRSYIQHINTSYISLKFIVSSYTNMPHMITYFVFLFVTLNLDCNRKQKQYLLSYEL